MDISIDEIIKIAQKIKDGIASTEEKKIIQDFLTETPNDIRSILEELN